MLEYIKFDISTRKNKKLMASFYDNYKNLIKTTHFGARGYKDYIYYITDNIQNAYKKQNYYIKRHKPMNKEWSNPINPGTLSRYILWNKPTLKKSIINFMEMFDLKPLEPIDFDKLRAGHKITHHLFSN